MYAPRAHTCTHTQHCPTPAVRRLLITAERGSGGLLGLTAVLCAVLQAANVSEIVSGKTPDLGLFRVLLPAILLHGFYDFALFLLAVFSYAEELDTSTGFQMFTLCISFLTFLGGVKYAHVRFKQVSILKRKSADAKY